MNEEDTGKTVYYTLDPNNLPPRMTRAERKALRRRPIDYSDIPRQIVDETWYRPAWALKIAERKARASG